MRKPLHRSPRCLWQHLAFYCDQMQRTQITSTYCTNRVLFVSFGLHMFGFVFVFQGRLVFWVLTSQQNLDRNKHHNITASTGGHQAGAKPGARFRKAHYARHGRRRILSPPTRECRKPHVKFHRLFSKKKSPRFFRWRHFFVCQDQHIHFVCLACPNPTVLMLVSKFISIAVVDSVGGWVGSQSSNYKTEKSFANTVVLTSTCCFPKTKDDRSQANMAEATSRRAVSFGLRKYQTWTGLGP